jgi:hypothetical protein
VKLAALLFAALGAALFAWMRAAFRRGDKGMNLTQAIQDVEATQTALAQADGVLTAANDKLAQAQATQTAASTADKDAAAAANAALDTLIETATAAKRQG